MEIGLARGLAQDLQYDQRIADLRYQKQEMDRATAINDAKAKMFSDDMDFQNATNSFDNPRIKEYAKNQIAAIGKFVTENPDWTSNVQKRSQLNLMKRELKDNPELQRGMASDEAFKRLNADLAEVAKNPEAHDEEEYNNLLAQRDNYIKYGNQDGEEAANKIGTKAFVYTKPRDLRDLNKDWAALGNDFRDVKRNPMAGKGRNAFQEYANPDSLRIVANQYYSQNKKQLDREAAKVGMDPIAYTMKGIDGHIKKNTDYGDYNLSDAMAVRRASEKAPAGPPGPTTWDVEIKGKDMGMENGDTMMKVLGPPAGIKIKDYDGNPVDMTGINFKYTGNHERVKVKVLGKDGKYKDAYQKLFEVYTEVPIKVSNELGFTEDPWLGGVEVSDKFKGKNIDIVTRQNSKGEAVKYARIKTKVPVDTDNEGFRQRYDAENMASKFRQGVDQGQAVEIDSEGNVFDAVTKQFIRKQ
jgi:hypothetical protein